ncbi:hypothetical protein Desor_4495 [Desulfosporosinus orientis DSM 765]|uniref:Uncharacterized protein n=1 Tax=Desulfosporosinus orientis (strain ATCC 19365 / DSM 765 / NCIMB 8382 / VKM B-1628 / Singapore I) TaxID=768706 RepID=G7W9I7_DESOD|nr:hypothetical protein [Desulfosporosinus orientis]AET69904.1 hypothetical protein Desor_4495 [Desulfosporosinus orientis DSM 765]
MCKIKDKVILGLVVGLLANIPKTVLCETLYYKGITKGKCSNLAASLFLAKHKIVNKKGNVFGIFTDFITASFDGIAYVFFLTCTGKVNKCNVLVKGLLNGMLSYGIFRGILAKMGSCKDHPKDILTNLFMGFNSTVWGVSAGFLTLLLGHGDLFEPKPLAQTNPPNEDPSIDQSLIL